MVDAYELIATIGRSREGDPEAFERLVTELSPSLRRYCKSFFNSWEDADDAVQEAWIKAWKNIHTLKQNGAFKTWLFRMARNVCLDRVRSPKHKMPIVEAAELAAVPSGEHSVPEAIIVKRSETQDVWSIIASLPSTLKQAFILVGVEELTYAEAAHITNTSESTIRGRVARARKAIIEAMS